MKTPRVMFNDTDLDSGLGVKMEGPGEDSEEDDEELTADLPELLVNTFISEMAAQFRQSAQQKASSSSSEQHVVKPGEVPCDACTGTRLKALKSCLVCLESYCETHLDPHLTRAGLKKHQLIDPEENLEGRMCVKHDKQLELFCKTDQVCVCIHCTYSEHKTHDVVPLKEGYEGKKAELGKTEAEIQQMIQKRRLKIQEMNRSVELMWTGRKEGADREIADGVQVFTALKESVERSQAELIDTSKRSRERQRNRLKASSKSWNRNFTSLNAAPPTKNWTEVRVRPPSYEGTVVRAVTQLEETLWKQMKKLLEVQLKRVQQSEVEAKQSFSSGRFYYEVQVEGKTKWTLGVARESINRKGKITLTPQDGYWTIWLRNGNEYEALNPDVSLSPKSQPEKVGVFVDYEEGLVSFYDVDAAALIYSFTGCCFKEKLYPYFGPCLNDDGKKLCPSDHFSFF
nr:nuclear factor 7, brain-like [Pseudochaenichthys georgianus]